MAKTKIPWCDYSINPIKGLCPMACEYCYARKFYKRFKWKPEIYYNPTEMLKVATCRPGSRIFVGSTMELFGDWVTDKEQNHIIEFCRRMHDKTFIFLTKLPQNLPKEWPDNCWIGVSVTRKTELRSAIWALSDIQCCKRFLSLEPLLEPVISQILPAEWDDYINWVIIGSRTQPTRHPPRAWVDEIITACDIAGIPVFIKEPMASFYNLHRQEFPK